MTNFTAQQNLTTGKPKWSPEKIVGIGAGAVVVLAIVLGIAATRANTPSIGDLRAEAVSACETQVEGKLRAPASAVFDSTATGDGESFTVSGTVDSENGFGALLQTAYECDVTVGDARTVTAITRMG